MSKFQIAWVETGGMWNSSDQGDTEVWSFVAKKGLSEKTSPKVVLTPRVQGLYIIEIRYASSGFYIALSAVVFGMEPCLRRCLCLCCFCYLDSAIVSFLSVCSLVAAFCFLFPSLSESWLKSCTSWAWLFISFFVGNALYSNSWVDLAVWEM